MVSGRAVNRRIYSHQQSLHPREAFQESVSTINKKLQGRAGAVRYRAPSVDVLFIVLYLPQSRMENKHTTVELLTWASELVATMGHRVLPVVFTDANARLGYVRGALDSSGAVGPCEPDEENLNGELFRQFLEAQHLIAVNTHYESGCTFYGNHGHASRIDYIAIPQAMLPVVQRCEVWGRAGDALQIIQCARRRDHRPLASC